MFLHLSRLSFLISEKSCRKIWQVGYLLVFLGKKKDVDSHPQRREVKPENHSEGIITTIAVI